MYLYGFESKLNFLIQSLVKISRLEMGALTLRYVRGNVSHLMEEVIAQIEPIAKDKSSYRNVTKQTIIERFRLQD